MAKAIWWQVFVALLVSVSVAPASSQQRSTPDFEVAWMMNAYPDRGADWYREHRTAVRNRVLPEHLFVAAVDILASDGSPVAPSGMQFVGMTDQVNNVICSLDRSADGYVTRRNRICLIDQDHDDQFEKYFLLHGVFTTFFSRTNFDEWMIFGSIPAETIAVRPVAVAEAPNEDFRRQIFIEYAFNAFYDGPRYTLFNGLISPESVPFGDTFCDYVEDGISLDAANARVCAMPGLTFVLLGRRGNSAYIAMQSTGLPLALRLQFAREGIWGDSRASTIEFRSMGK